MVATVVPDSTYTKQPNQFCLRIRRQRKLSGWVDPQFEFLGVEDGAENNCRQYFSARIFNNFFKHQPYVQIMQADVKRKE